MPRHPPIALKTLDHSHYQCPSGMCRRPGQPRGYPGNLRLPELVSKRPASRDLSAGAVRQPIIGGRLSVSPRQTITFDMPSALEEQASRGIALRSWSSNKSSLYDVNRTGSRLESSLQTHMRMTGSSRTPGVSTPVQRR